MDQIHLGLPPEVYRQRQKPVTTSLKVADYFGKNHFDVLKAIKNLDCSQWFSASNFAVTNYIDRQGKTKPAYEMTRDGFMFTVMGFKRLNFEHTPLSTVDLQKNQGNNGLGDLCPNVKGVI